MKLPYLLIPRTVYEDGRRDLEVARAQVAEYHQLLIDMKLDGAQIIRANPELIRRHRERPELDLIDEAIDNHPKFRNNRVAARRMRIWADNQLAANKTVAELVERIGNWDKVTVSEALDEEDEEDRNLGLMPR